jgi:hypothetical protein
LLLQLRGNLTLQQIRRHPGQWQTAPFRERLREGDRLAVQIAALGGPVGLFKCLEEPPDVDLIGPNVDLVAVCGGANDGARRGVGK